MRSTIFKKIIAIIMALSFLAALFSCGRDTGKPVMTLEDKTVTDRMYGYWLSSYKAVLLSQYTDASDSDEFWDMKLSEGFSAEDFFEELCSNYIKSNLVAMYLFDVLGLEIEDEDEKTAENIISDMEKEYADGNRNTFNKLLSNYGVDAELLKDLYLEELKSTYVYNYVFENDLLIVGKEEKEAFLNDNYIRIRQIYVNNKYDLENSSYDDKGNFTMAPLDDETVAAQNEKITKLKAALDAGEDFDEVYEEYSEEKSYPNGYYISTLSADLPRELVNAAFSLEVGEVKEFESDYGVHIIKRLEMNEGAYDNDENADFFDGFREAVYQSVFNDYVSSYYDRIIYDEEAISKFSVRDALPNYSFQY